MQHAAGPELLPELGILGIVRKLGLFLGVQVIEVAEELVEAVDGGEIFVPIAEVVLAELAGGVAERLEQLGDGGVFLLQADGGARHADLGQAGADRVLAGDETGAAGGAALLRVVIGKCDALFGDAVDVGSPVSHHAATEVTDVPDADVVAPKDEDVGFLVGHEESLLQGNRCSDEQERRSPIAGCGCSRFAKQVVWTSACQCSPSPFAGISGGSPSLVPSGTVSALR